MAKFYGYARVSTPGQSDNSIESQIIKLEHQANMLGLPFEFYYEKESGKDIKGRDEFQLLLKKVKAGDIVGVDGADRFGRSTIHNLWLFEQLTELGVHLQVDGRIVDPEEPVHELDLTIESAVSQFHRRIQLKKSKEGIKQKKEKGDWIFTSRLLGYRIHFEKGMPHVEIVEEEAKIIRFIFEEYAAGTSIRQITIRLNSRGYRTREEKRFSDATIRRYIHKPIYKGFYKLKAGGGHKGQEKVSLENSKLVKSNYYPPIISEELWDAANQSYRGVTRKHSRQFEYRFSYYELGGVLKCGHCMDIGKATAYVHNFSKDHKRRTINENYANRVHHEGCLQKNHTFRAEVLEKLFQTCFFLSYLQTSDYVNFLKEKEDYIKDSIADSNEALELIEKELAKNSRKKVNLSEAIGLRGYIKELFDQLDKCEKEEKRLLKDKYDLEKNISAEYEYFDYIVDSFRDETLLEFIHSHPSNKRRIYKELIKDAIVKNGKITIEMINGKKFVTELVKNRGRIIQTKFLIEVSLGDKYQYTVELTAPNTTKYTFDDDINEPRKTSIPQLRLVEINTEAKSSGRQAFNKENQFLVKKMEIEKFVEKIEHLLNVETNEDLENEDILFP